MSCLRSSFKSKSTHHETVSTFSIIAEEKPPPTTFPIVHSAIPRKKHVQSNYSPSSEFSLFQSPARLSESSQQLQSKMKVCLDCLRKRPTFRNVKPVRPRSTAMPRHVPSVRPAAVVRTLKRTGGKIHHRHRFVDLLHILPLKFLCTQSLQDMAPRGAKVLSAKAAVNMRL